MIVRPIGEITSADIERLVTDQQPENRTLEYKQAVHASTDADVKEFLADVSSFANAGGGDILYGVEELRDRDNKPTGIPVAASGLAGVNPDSVILRMESSIRTGIAPRIAGIQFCPVSGFAQGPVIVVRIPRSWISPHAVTYRGAFRFYSRTSNGKYSMDVRELRAAFALSEELPEIIRRFRIDRVNSIHGGGVPGPLEPCAKLVIHLVPFSSFDSGSQIEVKSLRNHKSLPMPIDCNSWTWRYNFEGYLASPEATNKGFVDSYVQIFRNGIIEAANTSMLSGLRGSDSKRIPGEHFEQQMIDLVRRCLNLQSDLDLSPPIIVMLTFLGVKGYCLDIDRANPWYQRPLPIEHDKLLIPEVVVEELTD